MEVRVMTAEYRCDHPDPCGRYAEGFAAGKEQAHWEVRNAGLGAHDASCGREACLSAARVMEIWLETMATSDLQEDRALYEVFRAWVRERGVRRLLDES